MTSQQKADDLTVCLVSAGLLCWIHSDKIAGPLSLIGLFTLDAVAVWFLLKLVRWSFL